MNNEDRMIPYAAMTA